MVLEKQHYKKIAKKEINENSTYLNELHKRRDELNKMLGTNIIEIDSCDLDCNSYNLILTNDGYLYTEKKEYNSSISIIELLGYINPKKIDIFLKYVLEEEKILDRNTNFTIEEKLVFDENTVIYFNYNGKSYFLSDYYSIRDSNHHISKFLEEKLISLAEIKNSSIRFSEIIMIKKEISEINTYLKENENDEDDCDLPDILRKWRKIICV